MAFALPALILVAALGLRVADPSALQRLRDYAFDTFQRTSPRPWAAEVLPVRIVDIDDSALARHGQWPWPRDLVARLVDALSEAGATVIVFDVLFSEPDGKSPSRFVEEVKAATDAETAARFAAAARDNDATLAEAIARSGRVVIAFAEDQTVGGGGGRLPKALHTVVVNGRDEDWRPFVRHVPAATPSLPAFEAVAVGYGNIMVDIQAEVIRSVPLLTRLGAAERPYPTLALEAVRVLQTRVEAIRPGTSYVVRAGAASQQARGFGVSTTGIYGIGIGEVRIDTDPYGRVFLFDSGHKPERYVSAGAVLAGTVDKAKLEGHVVLIGSSAPALRDVRNTPVSAGISGTEVHAQLIEQMILAWQGPAMASAPDTPPAVREMARRPFLIRPDFASGAEIVYLLVAGLVFVLLLPRLRAGPMAVVAAGGVGVALVVPWLLYDRIGALFDPVYPAGTLAAMYVVGSAAGFMRTEAERAQIRGAFGLYLSPDVVEELARHPDRLKLGGEVRELTVMFTDLRGFTTISEQFDPPGLTRFMNRFLTPMTDIILAHRGTVDKYMGDAIMAFWNAPLDVSDHAAKACVSALAMQARLRDLNVEWRREAHEEGRNHIPVNIGIGLNSGRASVGNFGSDQRFTYTGIGDDVNLASRLEGQCKTYGVGIIVGDDTREAAPDFAYVELDLIKVKGKTEPERIHALVGDAAMRHDEAFRDLLVAHEEFLGEYRLGEFAAARARVPALRTLAEAAGWTSQYYAHMAQRLRALEDDPPPAWDGVHVAQEK
ncbi:MAG: adenylate/guanylate cyclase domain-containing protein [Rhodospirillales bacterium]|nr:MAG: adenylate/guanylate cyclase domain-containing protein [Rhodospirillales bacterium]